MVRLKDVIKIVDENILNAMAYTLWKISYKEVIDYRTKEYDDFVNEFIEFVSKGENNLLSVSIGGYELFEVDRLSLMCARFNNFRHSMYITDTFLVTEVYKDYFKVSLLNEFDEKEFYRLGKLTLIREFLDSLQFPYDQELKKFYRLGFEFKK